MLLLAAAAVAASVGPLTDTRSETLPNGLRVIVSPMPAARRVAVHLALAVGAADDPPGRPGLAHVFEHAAYTGVRDTPDANYDLELAAVGGVSSGWTTHDAVTFATVIPPGELVRALRLERDRLDGITLADGAAALQRGVVERERALNAHGDRVRATFAELLWTATHPYGHAVLGRAAALAGLTDPELTTFARGALTPRGATLVVVGPLPAETLLDAARAAFDGAPAATAPPVAAAPSPREAFAPGRVWLDADAAPADLRLGWRTDGASEAEQLALEVAAALLADRLGGDGVSAYAWRGERGAAFVIAAETERPARLLGRLSAELRRLAARGPSAAELAALLAVTRTRELAGLDRPESVAAAIAGCVARGYTPDCLPTVWAARVALTPGDVRDVVRRLLPPARRALLYAGPTPALPGLRAEGEE